MSNKPWFVLRCVPSLELKSEKLLRRLGFEAIAPYEEGLRRIRGNNRPWKWPLFQGYVFASWQDWADGWNRVRGVDPATGEIDESKVVTAVYSFLRPKWATNPYVLDPAEVDYLLSISDGKFKRDKHEEPRLKIGDEVIVSSGPFEGRTGTLSDLIGKRGKKATVSVKDGKNVLDVEIKVVKLEKCE